MRIVVLTGYGNIASTVDAMKAGAVDYLAKPADADEIHYALQSKENKSAQPPEKPMSADRVRWEHINKVYELSNRNVSETARRLNMHRRTLQVDRQPIPAIALTTDTSVLSAAANDYGYEQVFARQIQALGQPGDVAIGISTSGNSKNVINGLRAAKQKDIIAAGFSGGDGGQLIEVADPLIVVPSSITARIQEVHIILGHVLCSALEEQVDS